MTLADALSQIYQLTERKIVFAKKPWTLDSDAEIGILDEELRVPSSVLQRGFSYFLDVATAHEVLEVFGRKPPTREEIVRLLFHYAQHDAFPDWVYER